MGFRPHGGGSRLQRGQLSPNWEQVCEWLAPFGWGFHPILVHHTSSQKKVICSFFSPRGWGSKEKQALESLQEDYKTLLEDVCLHA